ncbi:hypothetical protein TI39_contig445g00001, partial [Zymoseptoria brevis]
PLGNATQASKTSLPVAQLQLQPQNCVAALASKKHPRYERRKPEPPKSPERKQHNPLRRRRRRRKSRKPRSSDREDARPIIRKPLSTTA